MAAFQVFTGSAWHPDGGRRKSLFVPLKVAWSLHTWILLTALWPEWAPWAISTQSWQRLGMSLCQGALCPAWDAHSVSKRRKKEKEKEKEGKNGCWWASSSSSTETPMRDKKKNHREDYLDNSKGNWEPWLQRMVRQLSSEMSSWLSWAEEFPRSCDDTVTRGILFVMVFHLVSGTWTTPVARNSTVVLYGGHFWRVCSVWMEWDETETGLGRRRPWLGQETSLQSPSQACSCTSGATFLAFQLSSVSLATVLRPR